MQTPRRLLVWASSMAVVATLVGLTADPASATKPDPDHQVTICHRTHSADNPYVRITVDEASINDSSSSSDHHSHNEGNTPNATALPGATDTTGGAVGTLGDAASAKANGLWWSDIIPPFYVSGADGNWDALNWDSVGQGVWASNCKMPGEPEETFLEVVKNIPAVVEGDESITITFTLSYIDPDSIQNDDITTGTVLGVVDTCDITFTAGETKDSCTFLHLTPGAPYVLEETDAGGFTPVDPYYFYGGDKDGTTVSLTNSFGPATAEACKTIDAGGTGYDATGDTFTFDLNIVSDPSGRYDGTQFGEGDTLATTTVTFGTSSTAGDGKPVNNCSAFNATLEDNVTYEIVEEAPATGWTPDSGSGDTTFTPQFPEDADHVFSATYNNSLTPASAEACKTVDIAGSGYDPTGDTFTFDLKLVADPDNQYGGAFSAGDVIDNATVTFGTSSTAGDGKPVNNCTAFSETLLDNVTYQIVEETPPTGWTPDSGTGDKQFTVTYPGDSGHVFSAAYKNSLTPATAQACKVTSVVNGSGFNASNYYFRFDLKDGSTTVSTVLVRGGGSVASPNCATFKNSTGTANFVLQDGHTYTVTEAPYVYNSSGTSVTNPGFVFGSVSCKVGTASVSSYTPAYPGASGASFSCKATNTITFSAPLTPGYWKNHLSYDKKNPTMAYTAKYLPIRLGGYSTITPAKQYYFVNTTADGTGVFNAMNCSNTGSNSAMNQNAVGCLAGHVLATKLNLANGSDGTCISAYVTQADNFLTSVSYIGPSGNYSGIGTTNRNTAITIKNALDKYNNALGCS